MNSTLEYIDVIQQNLDLLYDMIRDSNITGEAEGDMRDLLSDIVGALEELKQEVLRNGNTEKVNETRETD